MLRTVQAAQAAAVVALAVASAPGAAAAQVPNPAVSGPVAATAAPGDPSHDYPFFASNIDLAARGYVEQEYFIEGTANRYDTPGTATGTVIDGGHPYRTRIVVRRPANAERFNGTVLLEWQNVTNGMDQEQTYYEFADHLLDAGYAWVGVSAQRVGVDFLKTWNPSRYGTLDVSDGGAITNDALSYDVMSQAAQAVEHPSGVDPLGGLRPSTVIAIGHSQSASRLATYVNAIQPLSHAYDGFMLWGSLANQIRSDLEVPVWKILSEYDTALLEGRVRRPDDDKFVTWEVTGTSHNDAAALSFRRPLALRDIGTATEDSLQCDHPIGTTTPIGHPMAAGLDKLVAWAHGGPRLPSATPLTFASGPPGELSRDAFGIALGGLRLSQIAVPIATSNGINTGPGTCDRWGFTEPFDEATLLELYPSHAEYVAKVTDAVEANVAAGYVNPDDGAAVIREAQASAVGTKSESAETTVGGTVPATLSLDLAGNASFGAFAPGVERRYSASTLATVTSSAGSATLSVAGDGHLANGPFALEQPLEARATGAFGAVGSEPLTLRSYDGPVAADPATVEFGQTIAADEALRTGSYATTLTFTLATSQP